MKDDRLVAMRVFQSVVETGGFTAAAQVLGVSQPFVSQTVRRLEEGLGVKLLHRSTRGHRLTAEGELFLRGCGRAIDAVEAAEAEMQRSRERISGELRVSAPLAFGLDRVVPILPDFMARHPDLTVGLSLTDDSVSLIEDRIDVAIRMGRLRDSGLVSRRLCGLRRVVAAAPAFVARHGAPETPADLARFDCLLWQGAQDHLNRWPFLVEGAVTSVAVQGRFRSNNGMSLYALCLAGMGIMRIAEHLARPAIAEGRLVPLLERFQAPDDGAFHAVFLPERDLLPRIRVFVDYLAEAFREPPW